MTITYALVETHDDGTETTRDIVATAVDSPEHLEALLAQALAEAEPAKGLSAEAYADMMAAERMLLRDPLLLLNRIEGHVLRSPHNRYQDDAFEMAWDILMEAECAIEAERCADAAFYRPGYLPRR